MENLYFLAITPGDEISKKIIRIQQDIADRFDTRASLKVLPHITLKAPFRLPAAGHQTVLRWFDNLDISTPCFNLGLKDFGAFHNTSKPVIFINPEYSISLMKLQKQILANFTNTFTDVAIMNLEMNFHPHLTVAYRDLKLNLFQEAWKEFKLKKFSETWEVSNFHLLQHDGRKWNIIRSFSLN